MLYSAKKIQDQERINCIYDLDQAVDAPYVRKRRGIDLIYDPLHRTLSIEIRYKKLIASDTELVRSLQFANQPMNANPILEIDQVYQDGTNAYRIKSIRNDQVTSVVHATTAPDRYNINTTVTHNMTTVHEYIANLT